MEEDIKMIEDVLKDKDTKFWIGTQGIQAIENLIARYKELEEKINKLNNVIDIIIKEFYKRANISKKCWMQNVNGVEECFKNKNCLECLKEYFIKEDK